LASPFVAGVSLAEAVVLAVTGAFQPVAGLFFTSCVSRLMEALAAVLGLANSNG